jgi:hypothetical protein
MSGRIALWPRWRRHALAAVVAVALAACASTEPSPAADNRVPRSFAPPSRGSLVVLLPAPKADDLQAGQTLMTQQLHRQLVAAGYRVALLDAGNHDVVWGQEVAEVGGIYDPGSGALRSAAYAKALSSLARRLCDELKCALVIQQRLAVRDTKLSGSSAAWDGQRRRVPVVGTYGDTLSFSGTGVGLSIELTALSADGSPAFHTFGGASLPYRADASHAQHALRADLFADDREIADGVRLALNPLLPR